MWWGCLRGVQASGEVTSQRGCLWSDFAWISLDRSEILYLASPILGSVYLRQLTLLGCDLPNRPFTDLHCCVYLIDCFETLTKLALRFQNLSLIPMTCFYLILAEAESRLLLKTLNRSKTYHSNLATLLAAP